MSLLENGRCALHNLRKPLGGDLAETKTVTFFNKSNQEYIRSIFWNRSNQSVIIVSVNSKDDC